MTRRTDSPSPHGGRTEPRTAEVDEGRDVAAADGPPAVELAHDDAELAHDDAVEQPAHDPERAPWTGPSAWVFPGLVALVGAVAIWGAFTIEAPPNSAPPGPGAVPGVIGTLLLLTAARMTLVNLRVARTTRDTPAAPAAPSADWPPVFVIVATLAAHVALLETLGWLLAGALLFWGVAYAFGARAHLRDATVALTMSAAVQVGFSFGLGLNLPGGVLELVL